MVPWTCLSFLLRAKHSAPQLSIMPRAELFQVSPLPGLALGGQRDSQVAGMGRVAAMWSA